MLETIGAASIDELFADISPSLRFTGDLDIPLGVGEDELTREFSALASRNVDMDRELSFLGAGAYDHFVPAVVSAITSRSEFATSYTPYQPEISQGTLQAIFEYQTAICELTGLDVSNASLYDGATAAAEAMYVSEQHTGRTKVAVLRTVSPLIRGVLKTYAQAYGLDLVEVGFDTASGTTSLEAVEEALDGDTSCLIVQQPNFFGQLEDTPALCAAADSHGALAVVSCEALSLGVLEAPGVYGADIAVGDGHPLGNAPAFGGPSFGFMAMRSTFVRRLPGRVVGETVDADGRRAYALTLQTREQHIRREKATSNICTNQALNALAGVVYLSWLGPQGLRDIGTLLFDRVEQVRDHLVDIAGVEPLFDGPSFREVAVRLPVTASDAITGCKSAGVHPGFALQDDYPELGANCLLVAVTERRTDADIDKLALTLAEVVA